MSAPFKAVIPARYASTRLPGKPLLPIAGKAMILHVCERALEAGAEDVVVATDDQRIFDSVQAHGVHAVMTSPQHQNGTERIAEVAQTMQWDHRSIVVNVQGDEPLLPPAYIKLAAESLAQQTHAAVATLATKIADSKEIFNPNAVKTVLDKHGHALYFSRAPIPWDRDRFQQEPRQTDPDMPYWRHIGLYAYTVAFLHRYAQWTPSPLESIESLEQLRILWHGEAILVNAVDAAPPAGVDTEEDLARVEQYLSGSRR
jgi:3-deoxy-manno-octulosonate cytidylyltransferase (CMP-KDO synthetase)